MSKQKRVYKATPADLALIHEWLDSFTLPVIDGPNHTFDNSDFVFIHIAMMYCSANQLLSIVGRGGPSWITVALLLGKSNPTFICQYIQNSRIHGKVVDTVDVYKGVITFLRKVLQSDDGSRSFTLFGQSFDAASVESVILIKSGLVEAGQFVIKEETKPTDPSTLIASLLSDNNIVSPVELRRQGIKLMCLMSRHCKEQMVLLGKRKNLPTGSYEMIDMASRVLGLKADVLTPGDLAKRYSTFLRDEATAKKISEKLANATGASKPAAGNRDVRFNQIVQQKEKLIRVVTVSPLDAPGLVDEVHKRYPLIADTLENNNTLSWNNRPFREAVASLDCLGQLRALARFTRDPLVYDKDLMSAAFLEQIVNKIADILDSSIEVESTEPQAKRSKTD